MPAHVSFWASCDRGLGLTPAHAGAVRPAAPGTAFSVPVYQCDLAALIRYFETVL